jgi:hypothetical protein
MGEYCSHIGIVSHGKLIRFGTVREISQGFSGGGDATRSTYRIGIARPLADLQRRLEPIEGITDFVQHDHGFSVSYAAGPESAAILLRELVTRDVPVSAFGEVAGNLEQAYLATGVRQVD